MPDGGELRREHFIDLMASELVRVASTTVHPTRFLEESGEALRHALRRLIEASSAEDSEQLLEMIDHHFHEAKTMAMERILIANANFTSAKG